ncbi:mannonate dehydratase [Enterococcus alcedinis]|uniref:mannonate dehydratase n=1 Tax=Enterococcus alcedinis TaxID=1274384 RepID=A0A917N5P3_9ENTE|nr:mannonate dehydratase [Enterococcus alcedinis]MBP2102996.1 mannonate dehydratase [Enterococcus alcedinis]GGI66531.1 mannonate dehydratase [Enterococcus alcedinis]
MKLGLGLYRHMLTDENFQFAQQAGCTAIIAHLANYYEEILPATDGEVNYGKVREKDPIWELEHLIALKEQMAHYGLEFYGIENFSPGDWYDVLLDGPKRAEQMERLKEIIRNVGKAGIKTFGYNFSIAGVWGHSKKPVARGNAISSTFSADELPIDLAIPTGEVWNMTYGDQVTGTPVGKVSAEEIWDRLKRFLEEMLPVAEAAGVTLAAHPDDPPMPVLRQTGRLVYQPDLYQTLIDLVPSQSNMLEYCLGSIQEMSDGDTYDSLEQYASQKKISYVHFRNVKGKVPDYYEVFVDEGDIDMIECMRILKKHDFEGVLIPDHTPQMTCDAPWHAGMAFALGYMRGLMQMLEKNNR